MSEYTATVSWQRGTARFLDNRYSRAHEWRFDGGTVVPASSSPHSVPVPLSDPRGVDPEEAFVAALSSCHMLWFLSIAAKGGFVIESYEDHAAGYLEKNEDGRLAMTRVVLRPAIRFSGESVPTADQIRDLHDRSHHQCYIANSVRTVVTVEEGPMANSQ
jgi:organic hydroperoxide reductase OsmC/OhrA